MNIIPPINQTNICLKAPDFFGHFYIDSIFELMQEGVNGQVGVIGPTAVVPGTITLACNDLDEDEPVATGVGPV
jgi:hypothetical protein